MLATELPDRPEDRCGHQLRLRQRLSTAFGYTEQRANEVRQLGVVKDEFVTRVFTIAVRLHRYVEAGFADLLILRNGIFHKPPLVVAEPHAFPATQPHERLLACNRGLKRMQVRSFSRPLAGGRPTSFAAVSAIGIPTSFNLY
jgi:hypothetical protein